MICEKKLMEEFEKFTFTDERQKKQYKNFLEYLIGLQTSTDGWTPCREKLPEEREDVQVTYLGYRDNHPYCNKFAYMVDGNWYWSVEDSEVMVDIIAWKHSCKSYQVKGGNEA